VQLTDALARSDSALVGLFSQAFGQTMPVPSLEPRVSRSVATARSPLVCRTGLPMRRALSRHQLPSVPGLLHSHGLWHPGNLWSARAARAWGVPVIVHPRGMLEPWALQQKAWKKRLALAIFQRRDLHSASALIATSEMEYQNLRRFGLRQPIAVIPNARPAPVVSLHGRRATTGWTTTEISRPTAPTRTVPPPRRAFCPGRSATTASTTTATGGRTAKTRRVRPSPDARSSC